MIKKFVFPIFGKGETVPVYSLSFDLTSRSGRVSRTRRNRLKRILDKFPDHLYFSVSQYLISTDQNIDEFDASIQKILDKNHKVLVTEFSKNYCGSMHQDNWDWIDERMQ